jgi:co-chaperonin GroES (HSP10)
MSNKYIEPYEPAGHTVLVKLKTTETEEKYTYNKSTQKWEELSPSGFVISSISDEDYIREKGVHIRAYVLALGKTAYKKVDDGTPWCEVGQCVKIKKYSGEDDTQIIEGEICRTVQDIDICGIYPEDKDPCLN